MSLITNSLQSIVSSALTDVSKTNRPASLNDPESVSATQRQPDRTSLSPFAQMLTRLQQLQQSEPAKYKSVTQQIANKLEAAAGTEQSEGNTAAADRLNQLSGDFSKASGTGDLPNIQDLAKAVGHHRGGHHMRTPRATDPDSSSTSSTGGVTTSGSGAMQSLQTLLQTLESNPGQGGSNDPLQIITTTLANNGMDV